MSDLPPIEQYTEITFDDVNVKNVWADIFENGIEGDEQWGFAKIAGVDKTVKILHRAPIGPQEIPCVTIGIDADDLNDHYLGRSALNEEGEDVNNEDFDDNNRSLGGLFSMTLEFMIWSFNEIERDRLYQQIKRLAFLGMEFIDNLGVTEQRISGGRETQMQTEEKPKILYTQPIRWSGKIDFRARFMIQPVKQIRVVQNKEV